MRARRKTGNAGAGGRPMYEGVSWTIASQATYAASQAAVLVALAKYTGASGVGTFVLALAITAPVMLFASFQLRSVQATDVRGEYPFAAYARVRAWGICVALAVVGAIVTAASYDAPTKLAIVGVALAKASELMSDLSYGVLQRHERLDKIGISLVVRAVAGSGALVLALQVTGSVWMASFAMFGAWAMCALYDWRSAAEFIPQASQKADISTSRLARAALPLGAAIMLWSFTQNVPRYFLDHYRGARELGVYGGIAYVQLAGSALICAFGQAATPRLACYAQTGDLAEFQSLLWRLTIAATAIGGALLAAAFLCGRQLLTLAFDPEFGAAVVSFRWVAFACMWNFAGSMLLYGVMAIRIYDRQLALHLTTAAASLVGSALLVPSFGGVGAGAATTVFMIVHAAGAFFLLRRALRTEGLVGPLSTPAATAEAGR